MKFIHLTDLHICPKGHRLFDQDTSETLQTAIEDIIENHSDAAFCAITGDLTHKAEPEAYQHLKELLAPLPIPIHMTIGNHDLRAPAREALSLPTDTNGFIQTSVETEIGTLLFLDTVVEGTNEGAYCAARINWLRDALDAANGRPVWLFMHHSPFPLGMPAMDQIQLAPEDCGTIAEALKGHDVRHLFFGHYHRPVSGQWDGIPFSSHRSLMLQCLMDLEAIEEVYGIREEPQYAVCLVENGLTRVHIHDFASSAEHVSMGAPEE